MWQWNSLETLLSDLRFGIRQLRRNPALRHWWRFGATTAIFSVVNSVLLKPLRFKDPARGAIFETEAAPGNYPLIGADYPDWQTQNHTIEATSLYSWPNSVNARHQRPGVGIRH